MRVRVEIDLARVAWVFAVERVLRFLAEERVFVEAVMRRPIEFVWFFALVLLFRAIVVRLFEERRVDVLLVFCVDW